MSEEAPTEEAVPPPAPEAEAAPDPPPARSPAPVVELSAEEKAKIVSRVIIYEQDIFILCFLFCFVFLCFFFVY